MKDIRKDIDKINQVLAEASNKDFSIQFFDALNALEQEGIMEIGGGIGFGGSLIVDLVNKQVYTDMYDAQEAMDEAENPQDLVEAQFVFELDERGRAQGQYWIVSADFNIDDLLDQAHGKFSAEMQQRMRASRTKK